MKIFFAGGGTAGHIYPALAVAEEMEISVGKKNIIFIGTRKGMEGKLVGEKNFPIEFIYANKLKGLSILQKVKALFTIPVTLMQTLILLIKYRPAIIIGYGGYASGIIVLISHFLGFKTCIMEQNSVPGFTNRILGKFAKKIFLSFEESSAHFEKKERIFITGNPIRNELIEWFTKDKVREGFTILIFGGSQGSRILNTVVPKTLERIIKKIDSLKIIHQTGENSFFDLSETYKSLNIKADIYKYIENIGEMYYKADLIIGRAGSSVFEISASKKPSVLVPFEQAADSHQLHNAKIFEKTGAVVVIEEKNFTPEKLEKTIIEIYLNYEKWLKKAETAKMLGSLDAAKKIRDLILGEQLQN